MHYVLFKKMESVGSQAFFPAHAEQVDLLTRVSVSDSPWVNIAPYDEKSYCDWLLK